MFRVRIIVSAAFMSTPFCKAIVAKMWRRLWNQILVMPFFQPMSIHFSISSFPWRRSVACSM